MAYNRLPKTGYLRLRQIIGNTKADPPISPLIPVSKSTWWAGVKTGRFPPSVKLGPMTTVWRVEDIRALIDDLHQAEQLSLWEEPEGSITPYTHIKKVQHD